MKTIIVAPNYEAAVEYVRGNMPEVNPERHQYHDVYYLYPNTSDRLRGLEITREDTVLYLPDWQDITVRDHNALLMATRSTPTINVVDGALDG